MKKTLIALAVAASAAVSGSAMAWTANGTGGSVDMGGTLIPEGKVTPWEVKVGDAVKGLDAEGVGTRAAGGRLRIHFRQQMQYICDSGTGHTGKGIYRLFKRE